MKVNMPSDNLSIGQKRKMNSECKTYNPRRILTFSQYNQMPDDLKREHLMFLHIDHGASQSDIAKCWNVSAAVVAFEMKQHAVQLEYATKKRQKMWDEYLSTPSTAQKVEPDPEPQEEPQKVHSPATKTGSMTICGKPAVVLQAAFSMIGDKDCEISIQWREL